jgi:hypothetical protein
MTKRDKYLQETYGITEADYQMKLDSQNYRCALCGKDETTFKVKLNVDHNHKTGVVRGLLCYRCNKFIVGRHNLYSAQSLHNYMIKYESGNPVGTARIGPKKRKRKRSGSKKSKTKR